MATIRSAPAARKSRVPGEPRCRALGVAAQGGAVALVGGEAVKADQAPGDVVAAFVRQKVAEQLAAAAGNDAAPGLGVAAEGLALEGVDLVADEAGDGHGGGRRVEQGSTVRPASHRMLRCQVAFLLGNWWKQLCLMR